MCGLDCKPANSPKTCGSCDNVCGVNDVCCSQPLSVGALCADVSATLPANAPFACRTCPISTTSCDNKCVDLTSSPQHCGTCNTVCQHGCEKGKCKSHEGGSCAVGPTDAPYSAPGIIAGLVILGFAGRGRSRRARRRRERRPPCRGGRPSRPVRRARGDVGLMGGERRVHEFSDQAGGGTNERACPWISSTLVQRGAVGPKFRRSSRESR